MVFQNIFCLHIGTDVAVINTVERVKFYGVTFKMSGQETDSDFRFAKQ